LKSFSNLAIFPEVPGTAPKPNKKVSVVEKASDCSAFRLF